MILAESAATDGLQLALIEKFYGKLSVCLSSLSVNGIFQNLGVSVWLVGIEKKGKPSIHCDNCRTQ